MSALLAVEKAQARLLALKPPLGADNIGVAQCAGRDQPAAALSAMDGYAIHFADMPGPWTIAGEVAAGTAPTRALGPGEAIRIFTGAMLPANADTVVVQEDVIADGARLTLTGDGPASRGRHVRARASDFAAGAHLLTAG